MSDSKSDDGSGAYLKLASQRIVIDRQITFDIFIFLEKNQKYVHWMREGTTFTVDRSEKLKSMGYADVYVSKHQEQNLLTYLRLGSDGSVDLGVQIEKGNQQSDVKIIKGAKVFGSTISIVKGDAPPKMVKAGAPKMSVDVDFLNSVIKSTQQVFEEQFLVQVSYRPPTKRTKTSSGSLNFDVASFISLTSQSIRGTIGLCFPSETYRYLLNQATATEYGALDPTLYTGCGEFLFAIYETARPKLIELGYTIDRAVPILAIGQSLSIPDLIPDNGFSIIFDSPGGPFQFDVGIKASG